jgi:hypothetical protein
MIVGTITIKMVDGENIIETVDVDPNTLSVYENKTDKLHTTLKSKIRELEDSGRKIGSISIDTPD